MISIILNDSELDLFEDTEVVWNWKAFRFQTALRDAYSNNFEVPKTLHNIQTLGVYSLLDRSDIQFQGRLQPAVVNLNGEIMPVYIQVVSINEKEIEICVFEDKLMYWIKGKDFTGRKDSPGYIYLINQNTMIPKSIFEWNKESMQLYPDVFKLYNYGEPYDTRYAQVHGSIKLNDIFDIIGEQNNVNIEHVSDLWRVICTKKTVCPENPIQVFEFWSDSEANENINPEENKMVMFGGQHITNDLNFSGMNTITFNRHTEVDMKLYWSFYRKNATHTDTSVFVYKNGTHLFHVDLLSHSNTTAVGTYSTTITFEEGDTLYFIFPNTSKYKTVSFVVRMLHTNYEINEDDYGNEELLYKDRLPRLKTYSTDVTLPGQDYGYTYINFNGQWSGYGGGIQTEPLSFSYFGLWCNFESLKIGDLLYSLQYILNVRVVAREDDTIHFENWSERASEVGGQITGLKFHSGSVGKKNYVKFKDGDGQLPIVEFDNEWLANEVTWSQNIFKWIKTDRVVPQYEYKVEQPLNTDDEEVETYEYTGFDEPVLLFFLPPNNQPPTLHYFGLDRINNCKEISLTLTECPPDITELDTIYLDGREYYIIEGEKNFKTGDTTIKALLLT